MMINQVTGQKIADAARAWLGTPYVNNSMVKGQGVDCSYLLVGAFIDSGVMAPDRLVIEDYSNEWHLHHSEEKYLKYIKQIADEVPADKPLQVGDILLYQYGRCISHGAIYMGDGIVIHAFVDLGVILSKLDDTLFYDAKGRSRLRAVYRLREDDK